jgi:adenosylcobinamide kinase / adenosylcobinamide-phosphate guanylyltransferase
MTVTLLIGGARSGKSSLAVRGALDWQRGGLSLDAGSLDAGSLDAGSAGDVHKGGRRVVFVATGSPGDAEMASRISRHQAERPSSWATVDAPVDLVAGLRAAAELHVDAVGPRGPAVEPAFIVDCVSMWVANLFMTPAHSVPPFSQDALSSSEETGPYDNPVEVDWDAAERELLRQVDECFALLKPRSAPTWFVTNEVGLSLVPMHRMGRMYRDVLGRVNAKVSLLCDEAYLTVAGRVLRLERP